MTESALWYSSADGLSLLARRIGSANGRAPLLCLHDVGQTSRIFRPFAQQISSTRRTLIPDMRGHGRSDYAIDLASYTIDQLAADAERLLDVERVTAYAVIGCGLGGLVALRLASKRPERVSAIILANSGPDLVTAHLSHRLQCAERAACNGWDDAEKAIPDARLIFRDQDGSPVCDWDSFAGPRLLNSVSQHNGARWLQALKAKPILDHKSGLNTAATIETVRRFLATCA